MERKVLENIYHVGDIFNKEQKTIIADEFRRCKKTDKKNNTMYKYIVLSSV